jgi:hypothetical protein
MGLSIRGYARHRRVTHQAVGKAIAAGRIVVGADGTIDPAVADQAWQERTAPRMPPPAAAPPAGPRRGGRLRRSGRQRRERVPRARAAALVVDVQTKRLALEQRRGAHLARAGRPEGVLVRAHDPRSLAGVARVGPLLAASFELDAGAVTVVLEGLRARASRRARQ